ncbi:hypothetical protein U1Q18_025986 [Sarracenia purpurea var. burkii]
MASQPTSAPPRPPGKKDVDIPNQPRDQGKHNYPQPHVASTPPIHYNQTTPTDRRNKGPGERPAGATHSREPHSVFIANHHRDPMLMRHYRQEVKKPPLSQNKPKKTDMDIAQLNNTQAQQQPRAKPDIPSPLKIYSYLYQESLPSGNQASFPGV